MFDYLINDFKIPIKDFISIEIEEFDVIIFE